VIGGLIGRDFSTRLAGRCFIGEPAEALATARVAFTVALVAVILWLVRPSAATKYGSIAEITRRAEAAGCDVHAFGDAGITAQCGPFESVGTISMFTGENPRWEASVRADPCSWALNSYHLDR
jgi:hypothetical protein